MRAYLLIALSSAVGGMLRFWLGTIWGSALGAAYLGTLLVNVTGSFAIGFLAAIAPLPITRELLMIGLLGGYTTFSTFSLQTLELIREGRWGVAFSNVALSVCASLLAVWLGHLCGGVWKR